MCTEVARTSPLVDDVKNSLLSLFLVICKELVALESWLVIESLKGSDVYAGVDVESLLTVIMEGWR